MKSNDVAGSSVYLIDDAAAVFWTYGTVAWWAYSETAGSSAVVPEKHSLERPAACW